MPRDARPIPDGWHAAAPVGWEIVSDDLRIAGRVVATIQSWHEDGPWYAYAETPQGVVRRLGAGTSHEAAAAWCERVSGYRAATPAERAVGVGLPGRGV